MEQEAAFHHNMPVMDRRFTLSELKEEKPWLNRRTLVFMSDFGLVDGAVSAMHGVADEVSQDLRLEDLTHDIPQFSIWEASYRLIQAMTYWAPGTVFISVVDPGVGSDRKSVAVLTASGHIVVTPDNGTLTHVAKDIGILERREISEAVNRLRGSQRSYTFHGRDVYAYTGARIASGAITFEETGPVLDGEPVMLHVEEPRIEGDTLYGAIDILDTRYGSLWTNIPDTLFADYGAKHGDMLYVEILHDDMTVFGYDLMFCRNFTEVEKGEPLIYINSLLNVGIAINQGSFSDKFRIGTGEGWRIAISKSRRG